MTTPVTKSGASKLWVGLAGCGAALSLCGAAVLIAVLFLWPSAKGNPEGAAQAQRGGVAQESDDGSASEAPSLERRGDGPSFEAR